MCYKYKNSLYVTLFRYIFRSVNIFVKKYDLMLQTNLMKEEKKEECEQSDFCNFNDKKRKTYRG